jgi:hypothetical protein
MKEDRAAVIRARKHDTRILRAELVEIEKKRSRTPCRRRVRSVVTATFPLQSLHRLLAPRPDPRGGTLAGPSGLPWYGNVGATRRRARADGFGRVL